jgi:hypothetical protein
MNFTRSVAIAALMTLPGCVSMDRVNSWQGRSGKDLVAAMGEPFESVRLEDGREEIRYQYSYERIRSNGVSTGSLSRGAARADGREPQLISCTVTFRTDPQSVIVSATRQGVISACQKFVKTMAAAN